MEQKSIRLLLVDDHSIVRWGIRSLIDRTPGLSVCGEAGSLNEAYEKVKELQPDIVLLDIKLPDGDGTAGCREIKKINEAIKVIILTAYAEDSIVLETVKSGADGYLLKNIESKTIIKAIKDVIAGTSVLDASVVGKVMNVVKRSGDSIDSLTPQEVKILEYISQGKTNKEIGDALYIAEKTVRNNVSRIMKKINVTNRTEAAIYWSRQKSLR